MKPEYNLIKIAGKTRLGYKMTEEQKRFLSEVTKGHPVSQQTIDKIVQTKAKKRNETIIPKKSLILGNRGEAISKAKASLSEEEIREIRGKAENGLSYNDIAASFGIKAGNVSHIVRRETYKWVI